MDTHFGKGVSEMIQTALTCYLLLFTLLHNHLSELGLEVRLLSLFHLLINFKFCAHIARSCRCFGNLVLYFITLNPSMHVSIEMKMLRHESSNEI